MSIPGPSSGPHRRGNITRTRENQNALPRTFLRARGGLGDAPTTTSTEDDTATPRRERKKRSRAAGHSWNNVNTPGPSDRTEIDVGKPLPRPPSKLRQTTSRAEASSQAPLLNVRAAKPSSRLKARAVLPPVTFVAETDEEGYDSQSTLGRHGSAANSELSKLQAQVLELKKQLKEKEKQVEDHQKHATKYKREAQNLNKSTKEQRAELEKLRIQHQRNTQIVSDVEQSLQCQICIDTLSRPYALSPCGHVLCLGCLQDWFRQAPISPEDMDTDDDLPPSVLHRTKTCPVCRTKVKERPLQLYMLKSIIAAVAKGDKRASPPPDLDDPWDGIFSVPMPSDDERTRAIFDFTDSSDGDAEVSDEDEDDASSMDDASSDGGLLDVYDNSSDDDYEGEWIHPTWAPPSITHPTRLHPEPFFDSLLRRGATLPMIEKFEMDYTHADGLSFTTDGLRVYLGWNLPCELADDDGDGSRFVEWCFEDMEARPERWSFGNGVAVKLERADVERYEEGDSEEWIGESDDEDEEMMM